MARNRIVVAALLMSAATVAQAQTNTFIAGSPVVSPGLTGFATLGSEMSGMLVEWQFAGGGGGASASWGDLGGGFHGVTGANGFRVRMASGGDSFSSNWEVQNSSTQRLDWLRFRGAAGRTLFDCGWNTAANPDRCDNTGRGDSEGTAGSADGWSLESTGGTFTGNVFGQYSNIVSIFPNGPVGDLFERLQITFGGAMGAGQTYTFRADTDSSPLNLPPPVVFPEPSTYVLMATGLAMIVAARRRRTA
jgi:hypothetical protein